MHNEPDIIFFGGTFDPPHEGHVDCVRLVLTRFPKARFLIVPALIPGFVGTEEKVPHSNFDQRVKLCEIAFAEFKDQVHVSEIESTLPTPNYSIATIEALQVEYPGKRLGMVLGMDQFEQFPQWKESHRILRKTSLIVVGRTDGSVDDSQLRFNAALQKIEKPEGSRTIYFIIGETSRASSSDLRHYLQNNEHVPQGWLNPNVSNYINKQRIYIAEDN